MLKHLITDKFAFIYKNNRLKYDSVNKGNERGRKMIEDTDIEEDEVAEKPSQKRRKLMLFLLPLLIVIGISVGIYFALNKSYNSLGNDYKIIQYSKDSEDMTVFFDLPEIKTSVKSTDGLHDLKIKITLELSNVEDLKVVEIITSKLNDVILGHVIELRLNELEGTEGLYWLKEELLYRLNLAAAPVKIKDLNFSVFELQR